MALKSWSALQSLLLPALCLLCGAAGAGGRDLCAACASDLPRNHAACPRCAEPLPAGWSALCARCQARAPAFDRAFIPFRYQPPLDFLIKGLKFGGRLAHARLLGDLFATALAERGGPWPDCILPIPLHPHRLRQRGFNQALELARAAAHHCQIVLWPDGLRRIRDTLPQTRLRAGQRQSNVLHAFALRAPLPGARVGLFDDVVSTASTVNECARLLRASGATGVEVWAIARAGDAL